MRAASLGQAAAGDARDALAALVRGPGPVVPWRDGALALLPFVDDEAAARVAVRVQEGLPEFDVHSDRLATRLLLAPDAQALRRAIAAA